MTETPMFRSSRVEVSPLAAVLQERSLVSLMTVLATLTKRLRLLHLATTLTNSIVRNMALRVFLHSTTSLIQG